MATDVYKGLFLIWIIFGLWQLHIDLESALHRFLLPDSKEKRQFPLGNTFLIPEEKQRWLTQTSLFILQTRHVLLCSYSFGEGKSQKTGRVVSLIYRSLNPREVTAIHMAAGRDL